MKKRVAIQKGLLAVIATITIIGISLVLKVPYWLLICLLVWLYAVLYSINDLKNRAVLLLFLVSIYIFLLGSEVAVHYLGYEESMLFSQSIDNHAYISISISIIGIVAGFAFGNAVKLKHNKQFFGIEMLNNNTSLADRRLLMQISRFGMLITLIPYFAEAIVSGLYVLRTSYLSYYMSYSSPLPGFAQQLSEQFTLFFFMFLATMPEKKDSMIWIAIYMLRSVIMLMTGRRLFFGMAFLVIAAYIVIRDKRDVKERWITKKIVVLSMVMIPTIVILLYMFKYVRYDREIVGSGVLDLLIRFFDQQGFSINTIKLQKQYEGDNLGITSLYYTLSFIRRNVLTRRLVNFPVSYYGLRNRKTALFINSLADYIMYKHSPGLYVKGYGYGTSYIAELYHDGGYGLLFLGSIFYGWLISKMFSFKSENVWRHLFALMMLEQLMVLPRYGADAFMRPFYNITKLAILIACMILVNQKIVIKVPFRIRRKSTQTL